MVNKLNNSFEKPVDCIKMHGRSLFLSIAIFFMIGINHSAKAQEFNYKVNAMYIYYFTTYINWPVHPGTANITIGVLGDSPVIDQLKIIIAKRKTDARSITVVRIDISEVKKCTILVVSKSQSSTMKQIQEATRNLPVLIVAEKPGLMNKGADICIYIDDEDNFKTKFEISKTNMQTRKLKVSNELLEMAEIVN